MRNTAWIMLKYVKVTFDGYSRKNSKAKKRIEKIIQRGKIGKELRSSVEMLLADAGYDELDRDIILDEFEDTNLFNVLPNEIASAFHMEQFIQYYDITEELEKEALDYINSRADIFEALWEKTEEEWKPVKVDSKQSFC